MARPVTLGEGVVTPSEAKNLSSVFAAVIPVAAAFSGAGRAASPQAPPPSRQTQPASWHCADELRCPILGRSPNYCAERSLECGGGFDSVLPRLPAPSSR